MVDFLIPKIGRGNCLLLGGTSRKSARLVNLYVHPPKKPRKNVSRQAPDNPHDSAARG
jgi:hypothetical protein